MGPADLGICCTTEGEEEGVVSAKLKNLSTNEIRQTGKVKGRIESEEQKQRQMWNNEGKKGRATNCKPDWAVHVPVDQGRGLHVVKSQGSHTMNKQTTWVHSDQCPLDASTNSAHVPRPKYQTHIARIHIAIILSNVNKGKISIKPLWQQSSSASFN